MRTASYLTAALLALAMVGLGAQEACAWSLSSSYDPVTKTVTIDVGAGGQQWNDLEIECKDGDVVGDYSTTSPSWTTDSIITHGTKKYIKLVRASTTTGDESVNCTYAGDETRGGKGTVIVTKDGVAQTTKTGQSTFLMASMADGPTLSEWGIIMLVLLMVGTSVVLLRRRQRLQA